MSYHKKRNGRPSGDKWKLDNHNFLGRLQTRVKWSSGEKEKAVMAIDLIQSGCSLSQFDLEEMRRKIREKEKADFEDMRRIAREKPFKPTGLFPRKQ